MSTPVRVLDNATGTIPVCGGDRSHDLMRRLIPAFVAGPVTGARIDWSTISGTRPGTAVLQRYDPPVARTRARVAGSTQPDASALI